MSAPANTGGAGERGEIPLTAPTMPADSARPSGATNTTQTDAAPKTPAKRKATRKRTKARRN